MPQSGKPVAGSRRILLRNARPVRKADPKQRIEVTMRVRPRHTDAEWETRLMEMGSKRPRERTYLSREELVARRGADPLDLAKVEAFAHAQHLTILEASLPKRTVRLSGTVAELEKAFGVKLKEYTSSEVTYRGRTGPVFVPNELAEVVEGVFGLDNRPVSGRRKRVIRSATRKSTKQSADSGLSVAELKKLYNFPAGLDGAGQCIAIIELNGTDAQGNITDTGYAVSDLEACFKKLGTPMPFVSAVGVAGGINKPNPESTGDIETTLDVEIVGAAAPGAKIVVYFAPNTDAGFVEAVNAAVHDTLRNPSVISISWGMPEETATEQFLKVMNEILQDAAALGVTVCCETGDHGSSDQSPQSRDGQPHVEFPASSPFALACGGTKLVPSRATIQSETVWNGGDQTGATGGGVSNKFPRPKYQTDVNVGQSPQGIAGRGLPDVAGNAVGYTALVYGKELSVFGTSAVAPLWASLITMINQDLHVNNHKPVGFLNPLIYGLPALRDTFNDIIEGNNDIDGKLHKYTARPGWDPCTGMGSPDATKLLGALKGDPKPKIRRGRARKK